MDKCKILLLVTTLCLLGGFGGAYAAVSPQHWQSPSNWFNITVSGSSAGSGASIALNVTCPRNDIDASGYNATNASIWYSTDNATWIYLQVFNSTFESGGASRTSGGNGNCSYAQQGDANSTMQGTLAVTDLPDGAYYLKVEFTNATSTTVHSSFNTSTPLNNITFDDTTPGASIKFSPSDSIQQGDRFTIKVTGTDTAKNHERLSNVTINFAAEGKDGKTVLGLGGTTTYADSYSWTFTPTAVGVQPVYVTVTDAQGLTQKFTEYYSLADADGQRTAKAKLDAARAFEKGKQNIVVLVVVIAAVAVVFGKKKRKTKK